MSFHCFFDLSVCMYLLLFLLSYGDLYHVHQQQARLAYAVQAARARQRQQQNGGGRGVQQLPEELTAVRAANYNQLVDELIQNQLLHKLDEVPFEQVVNMMRDGYLARYEV